MKTGKARIRAALICAALACAMTLRAFASDGRYSMSYIYFGSSSAYAGVVEDTGGALDEISPNYFDLGGDGALKLTTAVSAEFVEDMHEQGMTVVPFLSNHWDRAVGRAALSNRDALARSVSDAVSLYGLDGVCVDLENLTEADREDLTDFVRLLREYLPDGKTVSVAVAANPWGLTTGWQGSYDYAGLASYADYLMIMAYDEHYQAGSAGAVSSLSFAEKSVRYALKYVSSDRIVLGLAFYGRIWRNGGGWPQGYGVSNSLIDGLVSAYGGTVTFDASSQTPYATITVKQADAKPVVGGVTLSAGTYTIWYENEASLKKKLELITKYDLLGAGSWSLGQEASGTWNYYSLWLNGCHFSDSEGHWAQADILNAYLNGWVNGVTATSFRPDSPLTRAQAVVMLVRALGLASPETNASFDDTAGHWAQAEIETARSCGLINGVGDNLFRPDEPITREQMAVLLSNAASLCGSASSSRTDAHYTDVTEEESRWSAGAIEAMSAIGLLQGFPDGSFRPDEPVTRAQMTVLLERLTEIFPAQS